MGEQPQPAVRSDDPVEDHPYEFQQRDDGFAERHALIPNEYRWLWLNRDGTPLNLPRIFTKAFWARMRPPNKGWRLTRTCSPVLRNIGVLIGVLPVYGTLFTSPAEIP